MPYACEAAFEVVDQIDLYSEFLPWCAASRIRNVIKEDHKTIVEADLIIAFKVFRERFGSRVTLTPEKFSIDVEYLDGPFKYLNNHWIFRDVDGGCEADFFVDFEFKSKVLQVLIGVVFNEAMQRIVKAFEMRADDLYK